MHSSPAVKRTELGVISGDIFPGQRRISYLELVSGVVSQCEWAKVGGDGGHIVKIKESPHKRLQYGCESNLLFQWLWETKIK